MSGDGTQPSMIRATTELRTAAERILGLESAAGKRGAARSPAAAVVCERLRRVLSTLLGAAGFRALLSRAVTLAKAEVPELRAVAVQLDGSLARLSLDDGLGGDELADGEVVLVAHILGLLVTFVGEALMLRLVNEAWPKVRLDDLDFDKVNRD
jgi:hypothetical protein